MKRTIAQRMAPHIHINADLPWSAEILQSIIDAHDVGDYRAPCWLWSGRVTRNKPHIKRRIRYTEQGHVPSVEVVRTAPEIEIAGKRHHPARVLFQLVTAVTVDPRIQVMSTCGTSICVNPAHRRSAVTGAEQTLPAPLPPPLLDDDELFELLNNHTRRYRSIEELRDALGHEFTLAEYQSVFTRHPELRKELIR